MIAGGIKNKQCSYIGGCLQTFSLSFSTLSLSTFRKREREREHGKAVGKKGIGLIGMIRISLSPTVAHRKGSTERTTRRSINATLIRYRDQTNGRVQIPQKNLRQNTIFFWGYFRIYFLFHNSSHCFAFLFSWSSFAWRPRQQFLRSNRWPRTCWGCSFPWTGPGCHLKRKW